MKTISLSIKTQLILTFIAISSIVIIVVSYFNFTSNIKQEKNSFIQNSLIQANLLADFSVSALVFRDMDGAKENLEKLKSDNNIQRVIIFDNQGDIFSEYNPLDIREIAQIDIKEVHLVSKKEEFLNYGILKISVPLKHNNIVYGTLYLEKSTAIITKLLKKLFSEVILFACVLLLLIYAISIFLSNYLLKPILSLASTAEEIASTQNYGTRVSYNSKNEIGSLYKAFNSLVKDTENLTNNLELQVNIRTKELNTKTVQLEESLIDLQQTQQKLIESEKLSALGNLVSGIAHEVNTPLGNAITGSSVITKETQALVEEFNDGTLKKSTMQRRLDVINETSSLLSRTLHYASGLIKSFKQISVDQVTNDIREIQIKDYIEEVFLTNHNKLKLVPAKVTIEANDDLVIKTSPGVISQIINNLIQNSIKHGFDNYKGEAQISVCIEEKDENLIIEYEDNGIGINEDIKEKVFEPFVTTKRNSGGTGLGLNIVYNLIIQKLKGSLEMTSTENIGTKFIITIPMKNSLMEKK
ncbi:ATP-binding protein [Poseidonibacter lekithochrous]|uniref:ATP-binding protein n=1 Tax=Poseidonibacter lekithochrous TaxID=1904463 RepID=UPI000D3B1C98|nr:ATP-binding protein [Poseidonibacter lekithochrous]